MAGILKRLTSLLLTAILLSALLCLPARASGGYDPVHPELLEEGDLDAYAAILVDAASGLVIYEKNADARMYPASTTKILTVFLGALIGDMDRTVTVSAAALQVESGSSVIPLKKGERVRFEDLLYTTMVKSGNDGANVIAETISGSADGFVGLMNRYAASLDCGNTHFANPSGLHDEAHYTSARDMATITREAMQDETFRAIAATTRYVMPADNLYGERTLTSRLRQFFGNPEAAEYYPWANGVKTGHTEKAGYCFVGSAEKDGLRLISVVFRCSSYAACWRDTKRLMEYGFSQYVSTTVPALCAAHPVTVEITWCDADDPCHGLLELTPVKADGGADDVLIVPRSELDGLTAHFTELVNISYVRELVAPVAAGEVMAILTYEPETGEPVEYEMVASRSVGKAEE
ncbi:MAG: D-alanyl-D-alanine carboxypeptidase [Clostridia bacterium]|nr:D-alanyl-D-alanine carboxypeptidase [Clostridia bacterium]